jgi:hypothetical protein
MPREFPIGENDRLVNPTPAIDRFQFNHNPILDQQIEAIAAF